MLQTLKKMLFLSFVSQLSLQISIAFLHPFTTSSDDAWQVQSSLQNRNSEYINSNINVILLMTKISL